LEQLIVKSAKTEGTAPPSEGQLPPVPRPRTATGYRRYCYRIVCQYFKECLLTTLHVSNQSAKRVNEYHSSIITDRHRTPRKDITEMTLLSRHHHLDDIVNMTSLR